MNPRWPHNVMAYGAPSPLDLPFDPPPPFVLPTVIPSTELPVAPFVPERVEPTVTRREFMDAIESIRAAIREVEREVVESRVASAITTAIGSRLAARNTPRLRVRLFLGWRVVADVNGERRYVDGRHTLSGRADALVFATRLAAVAHRDAWAAQCHPAHKNIRIVRVVRVRRERAR